MVKSQLQEEYVRENIVIGQTIVNEDIIVKLNLKINIKIKRHMIPENGWVSNVANLSETRTLCQFFFMALMFPVIYFIFVPINRP